MTAAFEERLATITRIYSGSHSPDGQHCVMEGVAYVAGEPWSDEPACVSPVIAAFLRCWNDDLQDDASRTRLLRPLILPCIGTRADDAAEIRRAWMATDWLVRSLAPTFLRAAPTLAQHADALEAIGEIVDVVSARGSQPTINAARAAAGDAARAAARDALKEPVTRAQASAVALVLRMCAVRWGG